MYEIHKYVQKFFMIGLFFEMGYSAVFPSTMEGQYVIESFYTVELKVGTPPRSVRLAVDFSSTGLKTSINLAVLSRSFSPALGGSDIIHFDGLNFRVPLSLDGGSRANSLGCHDCQGSIGIGTGSNLWLYFKKAIFTAGSSILDESVIAYSDRSNNVGTFDCLPGVPNYCTTSKNVKVTTGLSKDKKFGKISRTVSLHFGYSRAKTIVPAWLYAVYTQSRNVQRDSDPSLWPDIHFEIPSNEGTGNHNSFKLRKEDIITRSRRTGHDLLLEVGSHNSTVILGKNAVRSFMFKRDWHTGQGQVVTWTVRKHWSNLSLTIMLVSSILFVYWKLSPSGEWKVPGQGSTFGPFWKLLVSALGSSILLFIYIYPNTQEALEGHLDFNVYIGSFIGIMILWQIFAELLFIFGGSKRLLGYEKLPLKNTNTDNRSEYMFIGDSIDHIVPYTEDGKYLLPTPASEYMQHKYIYLTPRL